MKSIHFGFMKILILSLITFLITTSCDVNEPKRNNQKPEGYQEDIEWPSLADSPWPMNNCDAQNTGRSRLSFHFSGFLEKEFPSNFSQSGIVLSKDSLALFLSSDSLLAYTLNGNKKFGNKVVIQSLVTPLIDKNGNIYTASNIYPELYIFDKNGKLIKTIDLDNPIPSSLINIDKNGNILCLDEKKYLYSVTVSGEINWKVKIDNANVYSYGISFSPDGKTLYLPGQTSSVIAFDIENKTVKWQSGNMKLSNVPVVDSKGNIYILPKYERIGEAFFICLNIDGTEKWKYKFFNSGKATFNSNAPTIDKNGNVYFATDTLYSLDFKGDLRWKEKLSGFSESHLICDNNLNIYVATMGIDNLKISLSCFDTDSNKKWEIIQNQPQIGGSMALGFGKLIFPSWRGDKIFIII